MIGFYLIGCFFSTLIASYEAYKYRGYNEDEFGGVFSFMVLGSWLMVILYIISKRDYIIEKCKDCYECIINSIKAHITWMQKK